MSGNSEADLSRRSFIKGAALGATALGTGTLFFIPRLCSDPSEGSFRYHPNLDPLRVVGVHDTDMTTILKPVIPWRAQDKLTDSEKVSENIDLMACSLAREKRVADAWKAILIKPPGKSWSDVTVAVKTNNLAMQHTRGAVMAKICRVLTDVLEVKPANVHIYDASHGKDMLRKTPFKGLPEGVDIAGQWGGFDAEAEVPEPWHGNPVHNAKNRTGCLGHLVKGEVDIIVNLAVCKGHQPEFGGFTMCMKNHFGTFDPKPAHGKGRTDYLICVNKTPLILGEMDSKKKKIAFPRQQLCIVDALWASEQGPLGLSSAQPNRLFMGTFGPAVDYLLANRFRRDVCSWDINKEVTDRFLTDFGFDPSDLPDGGVIVDAKKPT